MSPYEHGEVYVLDDGGEADLDLGNYERFLETRLTRDHNITTGKVYAQVIAKVRENEQENEQHTTLRASEAALARGRLRALRPPLGRIALLTRYIHHPCCFDWLCVQERRGDYLGKTV